MYSDNSNAVEKALANFQAALAENSPAFAEIADDFREMMAAQFASQGAAEGARWAPRVGPTLASARPRRVSALLVNTGALRDSLTRRGAADSAEELLGGTLSIGTRVPYADFHQSGTRRIPARPLIVLSGGRAARWAEFVRVALEGKTALLGAKELK